MSPRPACCRSCSNLLWSASSKPVTMSTILAWPSSTSMMRSRCSNCPAPSGVRLRVTTCTRAPQVARDLSRILSGDLLMRDWSKQNRNWFAAVQTEKRMMFIILTLIIAVAAFNLVSTLVMTVTDKQADIAILRTLGASPRSIMKIFMIQGALVGFVGTALASRWACLSR